MRRRLAIAGLLLCLVAGVGAVALLAQAGLASLGMQEAQAKQDLIYAYERGSLAFYPARKAIRAAAPAARVALVKVLMSWARTYTESAAFRADYEKQRAQYSPKPPKKKTVEEELARQKAERAKSLAEMKKNVEQMPANLKAQMAATVKQTEAQFAKMDNDPQMVAIQRQGIEMQIAGEQKEYADAVARHERRFPANPNALVAARLRQFLDVSATVDFNAKLVTANGLSRFENPAYEGKSDEWKLCYRTGREAVAAAREFAQAWLASLGGK